ncbi:hypothetical protein [Legionella feeleii]|uniref:EPTP domain protein n=2 Tax=Legionella feeleii TaxID=453 RepID=A0A0W0U827_9GAMM|nr:hypothetical protein [Legionella feeleii]KTD03657.1 EPTP domain protein [Legionella feeleii]
MRIIKWLMTYLLISFSTSVFAEQLLIPIQYLDTTGARQLTPFTLEDEYYIAVAQLAEDIPDTPANIDGGNADVDVIIFKKAGSQFREYQRIPGHGNESATFFSIGKNSFLAIASAHSGPHPPFNLHTYSMLYQWDGRYFYPVQEFLTYGAQQWYSFNIGQRHFLAVANGGFTPENKGNSPETNSMIYEWNGKKFIPFQTIPSLRGYSFKAFSINNKLFLAFADDLKQSSLYLWDGSQFNLYQQFKGDGGRGFEFFMLDNKFYLAYANIKTDSILYQWDRKKFNPYQLLQGEGGRHFSYFTLRDEHYLFRINFITGNHNNPNPALQSPLYQWKEGQFAVIQTIPTFGGISSHVFSMDDSLYMTLANSLSAERRFKVKSVIYEITKGKHIEYG